MENTIYLNGFTVLSFNPNNKHVTFKYENYLINDNKVESNEIINENEDHPLPNSNVISEEYWIVDENGQNKIKIINNENDFNLISDKIKAGPLFTMEAALLYLSYFKDLEL